MASRLAPEPTSTIARDVCNGPYSSNSDRFFSITQRARVGHSERATRRQLRYPSAYDQHPTFLSADTIAPAAVSVVGMRAGALFDGETPCRRALAALGGATISPA